MSNVKWVKITTDMFDNRKIRHIRKLPEGNNIILIWIMLLSLAGKCNASGMIFLTENIPYTEKMLADELGFEENVIKVALAALERFGMISRNEDELFVKNWDEYQNVEGLDRIREQTRARVAKHRAAKKIECNVTGNVTVTQGNAIEEDIDIEEDKEYITVSKDTVRQTEVRQCVEAWNSLSEYGIKTISRLSSSSQRYQRLSARIKEYGLPSVLSAIEKVKGSSFLQGKSSGKKAWVITFDWFVLPNNFPKVLDGNYDDHPDNQKSDVEQGNQKWKPASKLAADEWQ